MQKAVRSVVTVPVLLSDETIECVLRALQAVQADIEASRALVGSGSAMGADPLERKIDGDQNSSRFPEVMTVEQAAEYLNLSDRTIRELLAVRRIPAARIGRVWRFRRRRLDEWLDNGGADTGSTS